MKEDLARLLKIMFARLFAKWIDQHVPEEIQREIWSYLWPTLIALFLLWVIVTLVQESRRKKEASVSPAPHGQPSGVRSPSVLDFLPTFADLKAQGAKLRDRTAPLQIVGHQHLRLPLLISMIGLLFAAIGEWPYDFYVLMRIVVFSTCAFALVAILEKSKRSIWTGAFLPTAVLYNPFHPIHLHRDTWVGINWVTLAFFGVFLALLRPVSWASSLVATASTSIGIPTENPKPASPCGIDVLTPLGNPRPKLSSRAKPRTDKSDKHKTRNSKSLT